MEGSAISWTDDTLNPWIGCARVSPACDGCYAAALFGGEGNRHHRADWGGPGKGEGTRSRTKTLGDLARWEREVVKNPERWPHGRFVFCASLADWADTAVPIEWLADLLKAIAAAPHLTLLMLTKRIGVVEKRVPVALAAAGLTEWPRNAAIGATVVNQEEADRDIPKLLRVKAALRPAFVFLSMEPLLGPVDLTRLNGFDGNASDALNDGRRIDWVITGGETDQGAGEHFHAARPADPAWFRSLRDQCAAAGVPFHFKQWGEWQPARRSLDHRPVSAVTPGWRFRDGDEREFRDVEKLGAANDPCTLDGVKHDARPVVAA